MTERKCSRCKVEPAQPTHRWCKDCANAARREYRKRDGAAREFTSCQGPECETDITHLRRHAKYCSAECANRAWHIANPNAQRGYWVKNAYGVSRDEYARMIDAQNNACAICREQFTAAPNVDHNHETGAVRGLLCGSCNTGLGRFRDSRDLLAAAITYLTQ